MQSFPTALAVVSGRDVKTLNVGYTLYADIHPGDNTSPPPYIRLTQTVNNLELAVSSFSEILYTTTVQTTDHSHPDNVAASLAGLVYRHAMFDPLSTARYSSSRLAPSEWPPGRITAFALMLSTQTHAASAVPFTRTSLSPGSSVWTRADRQRTVTTEYKAAHVEVTDTQRGVTKLIFYPPQLTWQHDVWSAPDNTSLFYVVRLVWLCLVRT